MQKSHDERRSGPVHSNYESPHTPPAPKPTPRPSTPPTSGPKLTADEISKGLGLDD